MALEDEEKEVEVSVLGVTRSILSLSFPTIVWCVGCALVYIIVCSNLEHSSFIEKVLRFLVFILYLIMSFKLIFDEDVRGD
jgi:hypothetical protein